MEYCIRPSYHNRPQTTIKLKKHMNHWAGGFMQQTAQDSDHPKGEFVRGPP